MLPVRLQRQFSRLQDLQAEEPEQDTRKANHQHLTRARVLDYGRNQAVRIVLQHQRSPTPTVAGRTGTPWPAR